LLDSCPPDQRLAVERDLCLIQEDAALGVCRSRANAALSTWQIWLEFCNSLQQDAYLQETQDPIVLLRLFAKRYRTGELAPSGAPVRARTVENAVRAIGQTLAALGCDDPRLLPSGKLELRLQRQLKAYGKLDSPPNRVKPIPFAIIAHAAHLCHLANTDRSQTIADMILLGFYYLLRPGEYACTDNPESAPFRLCDVHLLRGPVRLDPFTATEWELRSATTAALEFTTQKNGTRGELIGLNRSGDPRWCPVIALIKRVLYLRLHHASPTTPLYSYTTQGTWYAVTASDLTTHLRTAATAIGLASGITASDISARSLRASGAMALLCAAVDTDIIRLIGRWRSDEMLRYLHVQALPIVAPLARQMLQHGNYALIPNNRLPLMGH
jgi:hypothetical protein